MPTALGRPSGAGRQPPSQQAWAAVKDLVYGLYVENELPLREVKAYLEEHHDFRASERMFKDRLKKWSFTKNLTKEDWEALAVLHTRRKALGKGATCFYVRERKKTIRDLQKYSRSQGVTEDILAANLGAHIEIPNYLRAVTPQENEDASPVTDSPSDRSLKSSLSPKPSPTTATPGSIPGPFTTIPVHRNSLKRYPTANSSPRGFLFPTFEAHDHNFHPDSGTTSHFSPTSSGSASFAMTGSTMATSIYSEDVSAGRSTEPMSAWTLQLESISTHADDPLASSWESDPLSVPSSCDNISRDFELMSHQLTDPAPLRSRYGDDDITSWMLLDSPEHGQDPDEILCSCAVCHQPSAAHFVSIHNTIPLEPPRSILNDGDIEKFGVPTTTKDEGAWKWIALCFASCLNMKKGKGNLSAKFLVDASTELERLVSQRDRMLLTAANQMMTILHMHNQGQIAVDITASAKSSTDRMLPSEDPIRITFSYLAATADSSGSTALQESGITSDTLYKVYLTLDNDPDYGAQHPYTITASYNHAWLLRYEGKFQEAENRLRQVYQVSCSIFGKHHMQSITAVATLAGSQFDQKKTTEAIQNFKIAIKDCKPTLGKSHPYRLEAKRRLALQYSNLGQKERMVPLYWEVLAGRVRMLGRRHSYTLGQKHDYEQLMQELGIWDHAAQRDVDTLFADTRRAEEEATRRRRSDSDSSHESECLAF